MQVAVPGQPGYKSQMKKATISHAKNNLSQLIDWVKAGETVIILDRHVPVARLEPIAQSKEMEPLGRLERLESLPPSNS
jgi:prevent-host-death family protein